MEADIESFTLPLIINFQRVTSGGGNLYNVHNTLERNQTQPSCGFDTQFFRYLSPNLFIYILFAVFIFVLTPKIVIQFDFLRTSLKEIMIYLQIT